MATTFAVPDGRVAMNAVTRNGFGASGGSVTSLMFKPDFFWEKLRNGVGNNQLMDSIRGVSNVLHSNNTDADTSAPTYLTSFNSNGYSFGSGDYGTSDTLVDWCWKAGGTAVSNTAGSITSTVSANTTAGFSVVTYTGTGANATVGHGLGVAPSMVIVKNRGGVYAWPVYHKFMATSSPATWYMTLNQTSAASNGANIWVNDPTITVFTVSGSIAEVNASTNTYVAYCWAPVAGYSAFGSYTGNGSADGPFIYTGFRPRWLMIKASTNATYSWVVLDSSRNTYNLADFKLLPNSSVVENDAGAIGGAGVNAFDLVSNGFKSRTSNLSTNESGTTYIYAAFAENPLKYANAR